MRQELGWTEGKEEELGELSIWHRMPTTYFHPAGLLLDDLDCDTALLPSYLFFFSLPLLTGQQRLHSGSRAWQSGKMAQHVTE